MIDQQAELTASSVRLPIAQTDSSLHLPLHNLPTAVWLRVRNVSDIPSVHDRNIKS